MARGNWRSYRINGESVTIIQVARLWQVSNEYASRLLGDAAVTAPDPDNYVVNYNNVEVTVTPYQVLTAKERTERYLRKINPSPLGKYKRPVRVGEVVYASLTEAAAGCGVATSTMIQKHIDGGEHFNGMPVRYEQDRLTGANVTRDVVVFDAVDVTVYQNAHEAADDLGVDVCRVLSAITLGIELCGKFCDWQFAKPNQQDRQRAEGRNWDAVVERVLELVEENEASDWAYVGESRSFKTKVNHGQDAHVTQANS